MTPSNKPIYVTQPHLPPLEEFQEYLRQIWESKQLTNKGPFHEQLEAALCEYLGVKYISLFANGTLALVTALQELRITGEVITTPYSFVATTHALWWNNIKPVLKNDTAHQNLAKENIHDDGLLPFMPFIPQVCTETLQKACERKGSSACG